MTNALTILMLWLSAIQGQQINPKMLYGTWNIYHIHSCSYSHCRDSMEYYISAMYKSDSLHRPDRGDQERKSIQRMMRTSIEAELTANMIFDSTGTSCRYPIQVGEWTRFAEKCGTYTLTGNKLIQNIDDHNLSEYVIVSLKADQLRLHYTNDSCTDLLFTREH